MLKKLTGINATAKDIPFKIREHKKLLSEYNESPHSTSKIEKPVFYQMTIR